MQEKNLCLRPVTLSKKALAEVFPCEFCEISKSTFLTEYFWTTASGQSSLIRCYCGSNYPAMLYLFKVNKRNTRKKCEICPKLKKIETQSDEHISHFFLVFPL